MLKFANARLDVLKGQLKDELKTYREFVSKNQVAIEDGEEELVETKKATLKSIKDLQKEIRDTEASQLLAGLNEQIRIQEASKKVIAKGIEENTTAGMFAFANMIAAGRSFEGAFSDIMIKTTESTKVQISEMALAFEGLVTKIKGVAESGLFNAVADIAFSIGDAIGGGINVLKAVGNTMLDTLGSILVQFGELTLAYGIANLALFTAITSGPNPLSAGAAIAAGAALIAIGGAVKAFSKNALSGGDSDSGASSGGGNSSFSGGSTSGFSGGSGAGGTYVFEIAGTKLVGVLKNTLDRNRALGGSLGLTS